jgi:hypothetical protein
VDGASVRCAVVGARVRSLDAPPPAAGC